MVTGKDMLIDRLFEFCYRRAGEKSTRRFTYRDFMGVLHCAKSPSLKNALDFAVQSGVLEADYHYMQGRFVKVFKVTNAAIEAAIQDEEAKNAPALPF